MNASAPAVAGGGRQHDDLAAWRAIMAGAICADESTIDVMLDARFDAKGR
jgi:hypothetical protein